MLEQIVACGLSAPSSKGSKPWRFTVVSDPTVLGELADAVATAPNGDAYTPHDPTTGRPYPEWTSTVLESAEVLRRVPTGIFVENSGPFSGGRQALLSADARARELAVTGFELEIAALGGALQSMWLAAVEHDLSCAFMGDISVAETALKARLSVAGDILGVLAVGYTRPGHAPPPHRGDADPNLVRWLD